LIDDPNQKRPVGAKRDRELRHAHEADEHEVGHDRQAEELLNLRAFGKHHSRRVTSVVTAGTTPIS